MSLILARFMDTETNTKPLGFVVQDSNLEKVRYFLAENGQEITIKDRYKCLYSYPWYFNLDKVIRKEFENRAKDWGYNWLTIDGEKDTFYYDKWHDEV